MSEVKVNKLSPRSGTTVTIGDSGDTISIPSGVTLDASSGGLAGTLTTAAQPNITSVGTLTSFTSTGIDDNADATAITIDSSENVGIGTTSPSSILHAETTTGAELILSRNDTSIAVDDLIGGIQFKANDASSSPDPQICGIKAISTGATNTNARLDFFAGESNYNSNTPDMNIDSSGNVGIGTTSPHTKLEVYNTSNGGVITAHKNSEASGDFTGYEFHTNSSATEFKKGAIYFRANGSGYGRGDIVFCNDKVADSGNVGLADEKLRIADTGRIHTNATTSPNAHLNLIGERGQSYKAIIFEHTNGGGEVGNITTGSSSVAYNTSSDYRLKENIVAMEDATTRLKQLQPKRFNFKTDADTTVDGFLAHEVSSIVPEAISGEKDAMKTEEYKVTPEVLDKDGNVITEAVMGTREVPDYQCIDQAKLVPLLVKTIQELEARITELENA
jgi:hypothetical protein